MTAFGVTARVGAPNPYNTLSFFLVAAVQTAFFQTTVNQLLLQDGHQLLTM